MSLSSTISGGLLQPTWKNGDATTRTSVAMIGANGLIEPMGKSTFSHGQKL
jgi:hypothetical protein